MRLTWRDGLATLLVAAAAVLYALWAGGALIPGVSTRWMTVIAFALASEAMLATLVAAMIALWLIATARHALTGRHPQLRAHPG